ncbi:hypothetical protein DY000_02005128 [Brassica cretica]|uniref:Uncharacterized protein n=1 Tax=Brassica cretica TaxID=69181 RepID=A0ABQ7CCU8_BRACR|nr:hypothetical protein DY000_02005128 [Brassica cretica]
MCRASCWFVCSSGCDDVEKCSGLFQCLYRFRRNKCPTESLVVRSIRQEVAPSLHFDERFILVATGLANFRGEGKVMLTLKLIVPRSWCDYCPGFRTELCYHKDGDFAFKLSRLGDLVTSLSRASRLVSPLRQEKFNEGVSLWVVNTHIQGPSRLTELTDSDQIHEERPMRTSGMKNHVNRDLQIAGDQTHKPRRLPFLSGSSLDLGCIEIRWAQPGLLFSKVIIFKPKSPAEIVTKPDGGCRQDKPRV